MSHINIPAPRLSADKTTFLKCGKFDKGVSFCKYDRELFEGQSPFIKNMIYEKNMLRTRFGQRSVGIEELPTGKVHSACTDMFFKKYVFHIGGALYAFDGNELVLLSNEIPDCDSFVFEMNSTLYFFCSQARIFMVNKDFEVSEHILDEVNIIKGAKPDLSSYTLNELPDDVMILRIGVTYVAVDEAITSYTLPSEVDTNYDIKFTRMSDGSEQKISYTLKGNTLKLGKTLLGAYRVSYVPVKGYEYRTCDKIFECTKACTYGGTTAGGTRVFLTGNKEYPGYYFHSELLSPFHFRRLSYDILGNGSESINCLARQKSDLIAFCDKSIYRIKYTFDSQDGPDFIVSEISNRIGSDIPGSVQLIDNRLVFANSGSGIHIIVSSEFTDELSIRNISANINGFEGGTGFLSEDKDSIKNCISIDFDRKYILVCPSGNAYVWDYGNSPYVCGDDPLISEKRLYWYFFDKISENTLFEINGALFGTRDVDEQVDFVSFSNQVSTDFGKEIESIHQSCEFDIGDSFSKKSPEELYINAQGDVGTSVTIQIFGDGELITSYTYYFDETQGNTERFRRLLVKIPGYELYRISFAVIVYGGTLGIYDAGMKFKSKEIYYR